MTATAGVPATRDLRDCFAEGRPLAREEVRLGWRARLEVLLSGRMTVTVRRTERQGAVIRVEAKFPWEREP